MRIAMLGAAVTTTLATVLWLGMPDGHAKYPPTAPESNKSAATSEEAVIDDPMALDIPAVEVSEVTDPTPPLIDERVVKRGDTLMGLLVDTGISRTEAHEAITALSKVYDPRDIRPGLQITVTRQAEESETEPLLQHIDLEVDAIRRVAVLRDDRGSFSAEAIEKPLTVQATRAAGTIQASLYVAGTRTGLPPNTLAEMIRIFSYDVDFQRDVQPGDSFDMMFEQMHDEAGNVLAEGNILIAEMVLSGKRIRLYRHESDDGEVDYFDAKGRSSRKALIMTPIDGARISSGFGVRRHPILGYTKMHRGVDFAAPTGTPIYAAGNGTVEMAGRHGGYGRYVRIRHTGTFKTAYAHMHGFAKGIHTGARVKQGQVIGYVGTSGRSTGPHLHYEILRNNAQINPKKLNLPSGRSLEGKELAQFLAERDSLETRYAALPAETQYVDAEPIGDLRPASGN
jgi:murein DD-endopeptidase MepM/ murein hydrolase activator NlpD